jgi:hypothetical protein
MRDCTLRLWDPLYDNTALVPLDVQPRCLHNTGSTLLIGHDGGLLALSLPRDLTGRM